MEAHSGEGRDLSGCNTSPKDGTSFAHCAVEVMGERIGLLHFNSEAPAGCSTASTTAEILGKRIRIGL